ncbi:hypothetical protein [Lactiplantibacillus brownii]|uniref:hypothetical protein n=1 Tax=Lactiplantibacillus brownii TaxID=3069269 RepID=UPI0038B26966
MVAEENMVAKFRGYSKDVHNWVIGSFWACDDTTYALAQFEEQGVLLFPAELLS